ncbi:unnamed protein product [Anisakis simplex]|uniref:Secreted protein n=1 Tax=Anisakis simplex TaxID=6269 RepID=A0A0M3JDK5_ANISI|nr:unnamed protein product [Anisakis simplex]
MMNISRKPITISIMIDIIIIIIPTIKRPTTTTVGKITDWVKQNCSLAKLFLPKASCEEINTLVASCHL